MSTLYLIGLVVLIALLVWWARRPAEPDNYPQHSAAGWERETRARLDEIPRDNYEERGRAWEENDHAIRVRTREWWEERKAGRRHE